MTGSLAVPDWGATLVHPHGAAPIKARIEIGHWLAECGTAYCRTALRLDYGSGFLCPRCGVAFDVVWPDADTVRGVVAMLAARPDWATRNWLPGESVEYLMIENLAHGIDHAVYPEVGAAASRIVLDASGDGPVDIRILDDPMIIDAAPRARIGR